VSARLIVVTLAVALLLACGGKGAIAGHGGPDLDSDPLSLLPPGAVAMVHVDAHGLLTSPSLGSDLSTFLDPLVPLGEGSGFVASRDVDSALAGIYSTSNADVAAILSGRFDVEKIAQAATTKNGTSISTRKHGHFSTHSVGRIEWCLLSPKTLVAGTPEGVELTLDRIEKGKLDRSLPPWAISTLQTPGAELAVVADFTSQPIASAAIGMVHLPWLSGLRIARIVGNTGTPGLNVAATLTYGDASEAQSAAAGVRSADRWLDLLGPLVGGVKLQNFQAEPEDKDVRCKFALDTQTLRNLIALAPRFLPPPSR